MGKATFYLHFARKEDILHEMAQQTAVAFEKEADEAFRRALPATRVLELLHASLAARIQATPPAAVARSMAETKRCALLVRGGAPQRFADTYERVLRYGQHRGELPAGCDVRELSEVLQAVTMDVIERWATGALKRMKPALLRRNALVLAGATAPV